MTDSHDLIWILDSDPACVTLYKQTLGLTYDVRTFSELSEFIGALAEENAPAPRLVLADPDNIKGSLAEFHRRSSESTSQIQCPELIILTKRDDLELMRFYLKTGVRDYIMKPLRTNELVAKVEHALMEINQREVRILRNEVDGIQISDLTLREYQLLTLFLSRPERSVCRDDLNDALWSRTRVNRKTLDVHVFNLRRKLRRHGYDIFVKDAVFSLRRANSRA